jgi:hypothetical protein
MSGVYMVRKERMRVGMRKPLNSDRVGWRKLCQQFGGGVVIFPVYQQERGYVLDIVLGYGFASEERVKGIVGRPFAAPIKANKVMYEAKVGELHIFYTDGEDNVRWFAQEVIRSVDEKLRLSSENIFFLNNQTFDCRVENLCLVSEYPCGEMEGEEMMTRSVTPVKALEFLMGQTKEEDWVEEGKEKREMEEGDRIKMEERVQKERGEVGTIVKCRKKKVGGGVKGAKSGNKKRKRGSTKVPGVYYHGDGFTVEISTEGGTTHLGTYESMQDAIMNRGKAEKKKYGEVTWITKTQLLDLKRVTEEVYEWERRRREIRCKECGGGIQIWQTMEEGAKREATAMGGCGIGRKKGRELKPGRSELEYAREVKSWKEKSDRDTVRCECGWVDVTICEIYHFGLDSAHIQEKLTKTKVEEGEEWQEEEEWGKEYSPTFMGYYEE